MTYCFQTQLKLLYFYSLLLSYLFCTEHSVIMAGWDHVCVDTVMHSFGVCSTESAPIQIACEDYNALCIQLIVIMAEQVTYSHTLFKTEHSILTRLFFFRSANQNQCKKTVFCCFFGSRELSRLDNSRDRADPISGQLYFPVFTKLFLIGE